MKARIVIESLPQAFGVINEISLGAEQWDSDYCVAGRRSLVKVPSAKELTFVAQCVSRTQ